MSKMLNRGGIICDKSVIEFTMNFTDVQSRKQGDITGVITVRVFIDTPDIE